MPSPQFEKLLGALFRNKRPAGSLDVAAMRRGMETPAFPVADDVQVESLVLAGVPVERIAAPGADPNRILLYLHGGGFVMGSPNTHRKLAGDLSRASRATVILPDYPLAPEHPFPAAIDAVTRVYEAVLASGISPERVAIGGDSAGGGLTASLLINIRNRQLPMPSAGVLISPLLDLTRRSGFDPDLVARDPVVSPDDMVTMLDWYLGGADPKQPLASPARADLTGLPPLLVQVGGAEVLLDQSRAIVDQAHACGVSAELEVWPDMVHVWHVFAGRVPEATDAVARVGEFVRASTGR